MRKCETSYGIIPLRKQNETWYVLLVKHGKGHWAFPKGHPETGEKPMETAEREFKEETGLQIARFLEIPMQKEHYTFPHGSDWINKTVCYFTAEVHGEVSIQEAEIEDFQWLDLDEAQKIITFKEARALCAKIKNHLEHLTSSRIPGQSSS